MKENKLIRRGKRLKKLYSIVKKLQIIKPKIKGVQKFVKTAHGEIKVLEYGFSSSEIAPLYVDLHGGGFLLMSAESDELMNLYFREQTAVKIISIDYPKAPENPYPIAVEAIYEIIEHYIQNAKAYAIDSQSIGIGGHSAGANLALVTSIRAKEKGDFTFRYQILDYPPLDLYTDPFQKPKHRKAIPPGLAKIFNVCYTNTETANSPYVSPIFATKEQLLNLTPTLMIVAGYDSLHDEGVKFFEMLKQAKITVEFHDFQKSAHGFTYKHKKQDAKEAHAIMVDFIKRMK